MYVESRLSGLRAELMQLGSLVESLTGESPEYGSFPELQLSRHATELSHLPGTYHVGSLSCRVTAPLKRRSGIVTHIAGMVSCITNSGQLHMLALHLCMASSNALVVPIWAKNASAQMESIIEQQTLNELIASLLEKTPEALESFAHLIEA
jgi:hypothetical protein